MVETLFFPPFCLQITADMLTPAHSRSSIPNKNANFDPVLQYDAYEVHFNSKESRPVVDERTNQRGSRPFGRSRGGGGGGGFRGNGGPSRGHNGPQYERSNVAPQEQRRGAPRDRGGPTRYQATPNDNPRYQGDYEESSRGYSAPSNRGPRGRGRGGSVASEFRPNFGTSRGRVDRGGFSSSRGGFTRSEPRQNY